MASLIVNTVEESFPHQFDIDLASLACNAAIELDNILNGQSIELLYVNKLLSLMDSIIEIGPNSQMSLSDPTALVVVNRAINDSKLLNEPRTTIGDFFNHSDKIKRLFEEVLSDADKVLREKKEIIESLSNFCLAISKQASAYGTSVYDIEL